MTDEYSVKARQTRDRFERARLALHIVVALLAAATLVLVIAVQLQNRETSELILDCTDVSGHCFQEAAKRQAAVIGDPPAPLNNVIILAAACADRPGVDTEDEIRACVIAGL